MKNVFLIVSVWVFSHTASAEVSLQLISYNCLTCHTSNGQHLVDLKTLFSEQIKNSLLDFKYDKQQSTVMGRITKGFTDAELIRVAQIISQRK